MKKVLLWVLMVVFVVALLVGGTGAALYAMTDESKMPENTTTLGGTPLEPVGYDWQVPLLGELLHKPFYMAPNLTVQKLGDLGGELPALVLPGWATKTEISLTAPDGSMALAGANAQDFANYTYTRNGAYELTLKVYQQTAAPAGKAQGFYTYRAGYTVNLAPQVELSRERASQGDIVAVLITGILAGEGADTPPTAETDLGTVDFRQVQGGWMGYIPVTYNAEGGEHTIALTSGGQALSATLTVMQKNPSTAETVPTEDPPGADTEYQNAIWPLYTAGKQEKLWSGMFAAPSTNGAAIPFGTRLTAAGQSAGRSTGIRYYSTPDVGVTAPQAGVVVYAGNLLLSGGTVVIDHGCGVKSYLFGLETVTAQSGQTLAKGDAVGTVGQARALIYELRIGSKSVDPAAAMDGTSGLQYKENLG